MTGFSNIIHSLTRNHNGFEAVWKFVGIPHFVRNDIRNDRGWSDII